MLGRLANMLVMEPGSLVMERKMLLGIKERAERTATAGAPPAAGPASAGESAPASEPAG
jgi:hypothetical protein